MTNPILLIPIFASFIVTLITLPIWISKARQVNLIWPDMNKYSKPTVAGSGGIAVTLGFVVGILLFVACRIFYLHQDSMLVEILALTATIMILFSIGLIDDLLGWQKGGLRRRVRMFLVLVAAVPLISINAGKSVMSLPFIGVIDIGLIYPLIAIPIGILGTTTTFNFLAGYNGLEAGQGIIMLLGLGFVAFFTGNSWLAVISLCAVAALLAFFLFNYCPAKVFPGDSLTYPIGGLIAIIAILGNFEKIAVFFFIPYIMETILKSRGKLIKQSFGKPKKDGTLDMPYSKIYGLEHLSILALQKIGIKSTEKNVVHLIWLFQIVIIILGFIIFREGIFIN
jgi:UDP-N-acetylglucosamine--dolichyl-phosphate N-acetylglucosaminephosphotransferase